MPGGVFAVDPRFFFWAGTGAELATPAVGCATFGDAGVCARTPAAMQEAISTVARATCGRKREDMQRIPKSERLLSAKRALLATAEPSPHPCTVLLIDDKTSGPGYL